MVSVPARSFGRGHCIFLSYCKAFCVDPRQEAEPDITAGGNTIRYRSTSGANASVPYFLGIIWLLRRTGEKIHLCEKEGISHDYAVSWSFFSGLYQFLKS